MIYRSTEKDLVSFYARVGRTTSLRVLVYNGDTDPAINSFQVLLASARSALKGSPLHTPSRGGMSMGHTESGSVFAHRPSVLCSSGPSRLSCNAHTGSIFYRHKIGLLRLAST